MVETNLSANQTGPISCNKINSVFLLPATYKMKKRYLQKEGCDPGQITDRVLIVDHKRRTFVRLDSERYSDICQGNVRL